ncbi:MAG TPA: hypothetical protein VGK20_00375 [Candidatus Binatia bacterium]|jgi:hypothetical protein
MPQAGFWPVGGYTISFHRDGAWYADDERIRNTRIQLLFSQSIRRDDRENAESLARYTGWLLDVGVDRQSVIVEDTPLVVSGIDGDPDSGFVIRTNDGISEPLDCSTLEIGSDDVLYCTVDRRERGRLRARFLRPAYYRIARFIELDGAAPRIRSRAATFRIR